MYVVELPSGVYCGFPLASSFWAGGWMVGEAGNYLLVEGSVGEETLAGWGNGEEARLECPRSCPPCSRYLPR